MTTMNLSTKTLADLDAAIPGLAKVWREMKADVGTRCRCPKGITITDEPREVILNDGECGRRFALDLASMSLGDERRSVSSGEWAAHAGPKFDGAIEGTPNGAAVVDLAWHDYYRYAHLTITVAKGALPAQVTA